MERLKNISRHAECIEEMEIQAMQEKELDYVKSINNQLKGVYNKPFRITIGSTGTLYYRNMSQIQPINKELFAEAAKCNVLLNNDYETFEATKLRRDIKQKLPEEIRFYLDWCKKNDAQIDYIVIYSIIENTCLNASEKKELLKTYLGNIIKAQCELNRARKEIKDEWIIPEIADLEDNLAIIYDMSELSKLREKNGLSENEIAEIIALANNAHRQGTAITVGDYKKTANIFSKLRGKSNDSFDLSPDCTDAETYIKSIGKAEKVATEYNKYRDEAKSKGKTPLDYIKVQTERLKTNEYTLEGQVLELARLQAKQESNAKRQSVSTNER